MEIIFKEKKQLPEGATESICYALLSPLKRFKDKIREMSVNVKGFNFEKPNGIKNIQVLITMKNGEQYYIQKSNISLQIASINLVKALNNVMSNIINKPLFKKRQRVPIYLYENE